MPVYHSTQRATGDHFPSLGLVCLSWNDPRRAGTDVRSCTHCKATLGVCTHRCESCRRSMVGATSNKAAESAGSTVSQDAALSKEASSSKEMELHVRDMH